VAATLAFVLGVLAAPAGLRAQGVTTGAVRGHVQDQAGQPIGGASIQLVQAGTGTRFSSVANATGAFFIANVIVGTYTVEARAVGYRPARTQVTIGLGRVEEVALALEASTVELSAIEVRATEADALTSPNRTGATATVDQTAITNLPSLNRNFADFAATSPLVYNTGNQGTTGSGTGVSIAGTSDRFNSLQVDGGTNGDLFSLASSNGAPGGANNSRPISVEAVQEYQVLIAPYDIRQGGFVGGLINAVTRSGTNEFHGSLFYSMQNENLVGPDTTGTRNASDFTLRYYGFSLGGPIIRDRLHFFVAGEWRDQSQPFTGLTIGTDPTNGADSAGIGITRATVDRTEAIANGYGINSGGAESPPFETPDGNIFAKLSAQLGTRSQAELSFTRVRSSRFSLSHGQGSASASANGIRDGYQMSNGGYHVNSATNSVRGRLNTPFGGRFTNEAIVSYNFFEDLRDPDTKAPMILVGGDRRSGANPAVYLGLGGERFSHDNLLDQHIFEITDNVTANYDRHVLTFGGRMSSFSFLNEFWAGRYGNWQFSDTTAFANGTASAYEIVLPGSAADSVNGRADGPIADFKFTEFSLYAQDQWQPSRKLSLSFGVRVDFQSLPTPTYNPLVDTATVTINGNTGPFGVRTDTKITSAALFSPRFGFNYDVGGDAVTIVRGGIGLFAGRTPYVWASNAYTGTGLEQTTLRCTGAAVPVFDPDPASQPTACLAGGPPTLPKPTVVYFDNGYKLPQNLRASLGFDRRLPGNVIATFDAVYTKYVNQFLLTDDNLLPTGNVATGEGGRVLYGTPAGSGFTLNRPTTVANAVLRQYNSNSDYMYSVAFGLTKRWGRSSELSAGYAYTRSYDLMSFSSDISSSLFSNAVLDGTLADRNLRPSWFDVPHNVRLSGTIGLPYEFRFSLFYTGHSGRPYAWIYGNDVNGDGGTGNDLVYVPRDSADITLQTPSQWATLNGFINSQQCLREARGQILQRGACRNPWVNYLDARIAKTFRTVRSQTIELMANIYNVPALLGVGGQVFQVASFENQTMLRRANYDAANSRGVYSLSIPNVGGNPNEARILQTTASRWKMELGLRYAF